MKKLILTASLGLAMSFATLPAHAGAYVTVSVSTPYYGVGYSTLPYMMGSYGMGFLYQPMFYTPYLPTYQPIPAPDASDIAYLQNLGEAKRVAWEQQRAAPAPVAEDPVPAPAPRKEQPSPPPSLNSPDIQIDRAPQ